MVDDMIIVSCDSFRSRRRHKKLKSSDESLTSRVPHDSAVPPLPIPLLDFPFSTTVSASSRDKLALSGWLRIHPPHAELVLLSNIISNSKWVKEPFHYLNISTVVQYCSALYSITTY